MKKYTPEEKMHFVIRYNQSDAVTPAGFIHRNGLDLDYKLLRKWLAHYEKHGLTGFREQEEMQKSNTSCNCHEATRDGYFVEQVCQICEPDFGFEELFSKVSKVYEPLTPSIQFSLAHINMMHLNKLIKIGGKTLLLEEFGNKYRALFCESNAFSQAPDLPSLLSDLENNLRGEDYPSYDYYTMDETMPNSDLEIAMYAGEQIRISADGELVQVAIGDRIVVRHANLKEALREAEQAVAALYPEHIRTFKKNKLI